MKQKPSRRQVSVRTADFEKATALRDAIAEKSGRKITISDTVARALACLEDAHARGAWLSPQEAAPVLERRHRDQVASVLAQFIARACPEKVLKGIAFDSANEMLNVSFAEGDPIALWAGAADAAAAAAAH